MKMLGAKDGACEYLPTLREQEEIDPNSLLDCIVGIFATHKKLFNNQVSETSVLERGIHSGFYLLEKELT